MKKVNINTSWQVAMRVFICGINSKNPKGRSAAETGMLNCAIVADKYVDLREKVLNRLSIDKLEQYKSVLRDIIENFHLKANNDFSKKYLQHISTLQEILSLMETIGAQPDISPKRKMIHPELCVDLNMAKIRGESYKLTGKGLSSVNPEHYEIEVEFQGDDEIKVYLYDNEADYMNDLEIAG
jgi:hypothetical protein